MPNAAESTRSKKDVNIEASLLRLEELMKGLDGKIYQKVDELSVSMNEKLSTLKNDIKEELLAKINTNESSIEANTQRIDELKIQYTR
jgi:hypothetical protein